MGWDQPQTVSQLAFIVADICIGLKTSQLRPSQARLRRPSLNEW